MEARREGMLRPEFQEWYPSLHAGKWYRANELTGLVVDHLRHGSPQWRAEGRVPSEDHFVFRGGPGQAGSGRGMRSTDPSRQHRDGPAPARP